MLKAFRKRPAVPDFANPPFPAHATMCFGIGAQKAGTTWLYDYLSQSEQVHFSRNKELHYFDVREGHGELALQLRIDRLKRLAETLTAGSGTLGRAQIRKLRETVELLSIYSGDPEGVNRHAPYLKYLLRGHKTQPVVGDITPAYAVLDRATFADMASIGNAKFIFILRDPVSRMWSQVRMSIAVAEGRDTDPDTLARLCRERAELLISSNRLRNIERANYLRTIEELEAAVPSDRILYVFYEDLFGGGAPERICDFLGIDPLPVDAGKRVNEGVKLPIPEDISTAFRTAFDAQYKGVRKRFGKDVPTRWAD